MVMLLWPRNKPDFDRLRRVLLRQGLPDRVPFIELFADPEIIAAVAVVSSRNSVANYIPVRNYLAMLDEGMKVGSYR